jgi:hypothetical protein
MPSYSGYSDYADSHRNETWQGYAAAVAAAYARELLLKVPTKEVNELLTAREALAPVDTFNTNDLMIKKPPAAKVLYEEKRIWLELFLPNSKKWCKTVE